MHYYSHCLPGLAGVAVVCALLGTAASAQPLAETAGAVAFDAAQAAYQRNHWPEAFAAFVALADVGHPEAARIALQMYHYGPALYGSRFHASPAQSQRWAAIVTRPAEVPDGGSRLAQPVR